MNNNPPGMVAPSPPQGLAQPNPFNFPLPDASGRPDPLDWMRRDLEQLEALWHSRGSDVEPARGACFTVIESVDIAAKTLTMPEGTLKVQVGAQIYAGTVSKIYLPDLAAFMAFTKSLTPKHIRLYCVAKAHGFDFGLTTKGKARAGSGNLARTKEYFEYVKGMPGVVCVDIDPHLGHLRIDSPEALRELCDNELGLSGVEYAILPSSSAYLRTESGDLLVGGGKWRVYVFVACQTLIPQILKLLSDRMSLVGDDEYVGEDGVAVGHCVLRINSAGHVNKEPTTCIDQAMARPVQPDFPAPVVGEGLMRSPALDPILNGLLIRGEGRQTHIDAAYIAKHLKLTQAEEGKRDARWARVQELAAPRVKEVRDARKAEVLEGSKAQGLSPNQMEAIQKRLDRVGEGFVLPWDEFTFEDGSKATFEEILKDRGRFDGQQGFDPAKPLRKGVPDGTRAVLQLKGRPRVWSHAGGGTVYWIVTREDLEEPQTVMLPPRSALAGIDPDHPAWVRLPEAVKRDSAGLSELLAAMVLDRFRWVPVWGVWIYFDGQSWLRDCEGARLHAEILSFAAQCVSKAYSHAQELDQKDLDSVYSWHKKQQRAGTGIFRDNFLKMQSCLHVHPGQMNVDSMLLNVGNGTLNLRTGGLQEAKASDLCSNVAGFSYKPLQACPLWLDTITLNAQASGEAQTWLLYVQELFGLCLLGEQYRVKFYFVLLGSGHNGKTALLTAFSRIMGQYAAVLEQSLLIHSNSNTRGSANEAELRLMAKRLGMGSDLPKSRLNTPWLKGYTGGETLSPRGLYEKASVSFTPTAVLLFSTNTLQLVVDTDEATWDRAQVVPFRARFEKSDRITDWVDRVVRDEASGVFDWALEGLHRLMAQNFEFTACGVIKNAVETWRRDMSIVSRYLDEATTPTKGEGEPAKRLCTHRLHVYQHFIQWATAAGGAKYSQMEFKKEMERLGYPLIEARTAKARFAGWEVALASLDPTSDKVFIRGSDNILTGYDPSSLLKSV